MLSRVLTRVLFQAGSVKRKGSLGGVTVGKVIIVLFARID